MRPEGWEEGICWVIDCNKKTGVWIPIAHISPSAMPDLFGLPPRPRSYEEWVMYPSLAGVCQSHYTKLRSKHGTQLAYTMRQNRIVAYVKERWF